MTLIFPSETDLLNQWFKFRPDWWTPRIPASWSTFLDDLPALDRGYRKIARSDLLEAGPKGLPCALVAGYVWGTGGSAFLVGRRARIFRDNDAQVIADHLDSAFEILSRGDTADAYQSMLKAQPNYLKFLGPSFFTKFLYSADSIDGQPGRALILDQFVAKALNCRDGWGISNTGPWSPSTYERWLQHAHTLASEEGVRPDAVELAYFRYGRGIV